MWSSFSSPLARPCSSACSAKQDDPDLVSGKQQFVAKCGSCHVLARAGTKGTQGPNLDEAFQQSEKEGFGESAIRGIVAKQIQYPFRGTRPCEPDCVAMPADLVTGDDVHDVAAYVASVVGKKGKDTGLLATRRQAGRLRQADRRQGRDPLDPGRSGRTARLRLDQGNRSAGPLTVRSPNESSTPHDIVIDGKGKGKQVTDGGVSEFKASFTAGSYTTTAQCPAIARRAWKAS